MTEEIRTERRGKALWISVDRPAARNALTFAMYDRIAAVCREANADAQVRAVVLTGSGDAFVAGTDIGQFVDPDRFTSEVRGVRERVQRNPPRRGFDRVYAPGDLENEKAQLHQREGIPFEQFTLDELDWVAEHTGVPLNFRTNGSR